MRLHRNRKIPYRVNDVDDSMVISFFLKQINFSFTQVVITLIHQSCSINHETKMLIESN